MLTGGNWYYELDRTYGHCVRSTETFRDLMGEQQPRYIADRCRSKEDALFFAASKDLSVALEALLMDFEEFARDNEESELFPERAAVIAAKLALAKVRGEYG